MNTSDVSGILPNEGKDNFRVSYDGFSVFVTHKRSGKTDIARVVYDENGSFSHCEVITVGGTVLKFPFPVDWN